MTRTALQRLINDPTTPKGRSFDLAVQGAIVVWLIAYCIDTLSDLSLGTRRFLHAVEIGVTLLFTVEYLFRLYAADRRLQQGDCAILGNLRD